MYIPWLTLALALCPVPCLHRTNGTITAGNASTISDGGAYALVRAHVFVYVFLCGAYALVRTSCVLVYVQYSCAVSPQQTHAKPTELVSRYVLAIVHPE